MYQVRREKKQKGREGEGEGKKSCFWGRKKEKEGRRKGNEGEKAESAREKKESSVRHGWGRAIWDSPEANYGPEGILSCRRVPVGQMQSL